MIKKTGEEQHTGDGAPENTEVRKETPAVGPSRKETAYAEPAEVEAEGPIEEQAEDSAGLSVVVDSHSDERVPTLVVSSAHKILSPDPVAWERRMIERGYKKAPGAPPSKTTKKSDDMFVNRFAAFTISDTADAQDRCAEGMHALEADDADEAPQFSGDPAEFVPEEHMAESPHSSPRRNKKRGFRRAPGKAQPSSPLQKSSTGSERANVMNEVTVAGNAQAANQQVVDLVEAEVVELQKIIFDMLMTPEVVAEQHLEERDLLLTPQEESSAGGVCDGKTTSAS